MESLPALRLSCEAEMLALNLRDFRPCLSAGSVWDIGRQQAGLMNIVAEICIGLLYRKSVQKPQMKWS